MRMCFVSGRSSAIVSGGLQRRKSFAFRGTEVKHRNLNRQEKGGYRAEANTIRWNSIIDIGETITLMKFP
jgi:hypothetical protein